MHSELNILSKVVLLTMLIIGSLAVWLLPKTKLVSGQQIGEKLFLVTYEVGILCCAFGLALLFVWPGRVLDLHLWELAVLPLVLIYAFWLAVMRKARSSRVLDEKQDANMTKAGALTFSLSVPAMLIAFWLCEAGRFDPALWFPFYILVTLLLYSLGVVYFFKRE